MSLELVGFIIGILWVVPAFYVGRISVINKITKEIEKIHKEIMDGVKDE